MDQIYLVFADTVDAYDCPAVMGAYTTLNGAIAAIPSYFKARHLGDMALVEYAAERNEDEMPKLLTQLDELWKPFVSVHIEGVRVHK